MRVAVAIRQLENFPTVASDSMVAVATLRGVLADEVISGYNYDAQLEVLQLFTSPRVGGGMPRNLLIHSLKVQRVSDDARVKLNGTPVVGLVPATRVGTTVHWAFVSNAGSTITIGPGPGDGPLVKVGIPLDTLVAKDFLDFLEGSGSTVPQHICDAMQAVISATLDALDINHDDF